MLLSPVYISVGMVSRNERWTALEKSTGLWIDIGLEPKLQWYP